MGVQILYVNSCTHLLQLCFRVRRTQRLEDLASLRDSILRNQPARTARDSEEQRQKNQCRQRRDSQLPAPLRCTYIDRGDPIVRRIRQQDADDDIDLKQPHQAAPNFRRRHLRDVDRTQHRRATDTKPTQDAEDQQRRPVPGDRAADRGDQIENRHDPQCLAAANSLP